MTKRQPVIEQPPSAATKAARVIQPATGAVGASPSGAASLAAPDDFGSSGNPGTAVVTSADSVSGRQLAETGAGHSLQLLFGKHYERPVGLNVNNMSVLPTSPNCFAPSRHSAAQGGQPAASGEGRRDKAASTGQGATPLAGPDLQLKAVMEGSHNALARLLPGAVEVANAALGSPCKEDSWTGSPGCAAWMFILPLPEGDPAAATAPCSAEGVSCDSNGSRGLSLHKAPSLPVTEYDLQQLQDALLCEFHVGDLHGSPLPAASSPCDCIAPGPESATWQHGGARVATPDIWRDPPQPDVGSTVRLPQAQHTLWSESGDGDGSGLHHDCQLEDMVWSVHPSLSLKDLNDFPDMQDDVHKLYDDKLLRISWSRELYVFSSSNTPLDPILPCAVASSELQAPGQIPVPSGLHQDCSGPKGPGNSTGAGLPAEPTSAGFPAEPTGVLGLGRPTCSELSRSGAACTGPGGGCCAGDTQSTTFPGPPPADTHGAGRIWPPSGALGNSCTCGRYLTTNNVDYCGVLTFGCPSELDLCRGQQQHLWASEEPASISLPFSTGGPAATVPYPYTVTTGGPFGGSMLFNSKAIVRMMQTCAVTTGAFL